MCTVLPSFYLLVKYAYKSHITLKSGMTG